MCMNLTVKKNTHELDWADIYLYMECLTALQISALVHLFIILTLPSLLFYLYLFHYVCLSGERDCVGVVYTSTPISLHQRVSYKKNTDCNKQHHHHSSPLTRDSDLSLPHSHPYPHSPFVSFIADDTFTM